MTFIVTLTALLIERFFDWSHLRGWQWYDRYQHFIAKRFSQKSKPLILALILLPVVISVYVMEILLQTTLFGLAELVFQLFIFLYCLGPQNLWADTFTCMNALTQGDTQLVSEKLKQSFGITEAQSAHSSHEQLLQHIFIAANRRVFAIVFWFFILGPVGAVFYRAVTLVTSGPSPEAAHDARSIESALNWIPVRIFTCVFALSGHFVQVVACWRKKAMQGLAINDQLLVECGAAALGKEDIEVLAQDETAEKNVIGLLDRSFIVILVLIAFLAML